MRWVIVLVLAWTTVAAADNSKRVTQIKAMLAAEVDAMLADDEAAFKKTATADAVYSLGGGTIDGTSFQSDMVGPSKIDLVTTSVGWQGTWGWVVADVHYFGKPHPEGMKMGDSNDNFTSWVWRRWIALVIVDGDGAVKMRAMRLSYVTLDRDLYWSNDLDKASAVTKLSPLASLTVQPAAAAKVLGTDPATVVYGTAPNDRGVGPAAAKKLLGGWSKLGLEVPDSEPAPIEVRGGGSFIDAGLRLKLPGKKGWIHIRATAIGHLVGETWVLDALVYSGAG